MQLPRCYSFFLSPSVLYTHLSIIHLRKSVCSIWRELWDTGDIRRLGWGVWSVYGDNYKLERGGWLKCVWCVFSV
jgi:hypothetical protein